MASGQELRLLSYFVQIVRAGSIRGAAARLSLSPAVVSEALSDLEDRLGVSLITRTTRSMALTAVGTQVFEAAARADAAADSALEIAAGAAAQPDGLVRLTLSAELAIAWLPPLLHRFQAAHPAVRVEVAAADTVVALSASQYDLAIRAAFSAAPAAGGDVCTCLPLQLVCAPERAGGAAESLARRLDRMGLIALASEGRVRTQIDATPRPGQRGLTAQSVAVTPQFTVDSQLVAHRLAREGFGAALLIELGIAEDLAAGQLVPVDPRYDYGYVVARAVTRDPYPTAATRALRDFLLESAAA
ncbi:MAG: LysR family transcriptional regulator [Rhodospirillaceae bacterium]|nr:LysR family transcriptional regulator [Rhodospirillaceae bacterium]